MKIILVTSQITYIPENSFNFYEELLKKNSSSIAGLFIVRNLSFSLLAKIVWLYIIRCNNIANTLVRNVLALPNKKIERLFKKYNLPVIKLKSVNDRKIIDWVKTNQTDLVVNFRARCLFKKELLEAPRLGCVNIHHGILPKYRGLFCDLYALAENRPAGFTMHKMTEEIDAGNIYLTRVASRGEKDYREYLSQLAGEEVAALSEFINLIEKDNKLPQGTPNVSDQKIITRTPSSKEIKKMITKGMIL